MELTVAERLHLLQLLPNEGNLVLLRMIADFRRDLGFSDAEVTDYQIRVDGDLTKWDAETAKTKDVEITAARLSLVKEQFTALDKSKRLRIELLPLHDKFEAMKVEERVTT